MDVAGRGTDDGRYAGRPGRPRGGERDGSADGPPDDALAAAVAGLTAEVAALHADRARRTLLDLAAGVLVDQLGLEPAEAADHLRGLAVSTGLGAADLAADIVNAAVGGPAVEAPAEGRRLRRSAVAVTASDTADEAARMLLDGGLHRIGVRSLYLWRRTDTDCLELAGAAGAGAGAQEKVHWQWVPPDTPLHRALWEGEAWWGRDDWLPGGPGVRGVLPLRHRGEVVGVALACGDPASRGPATAREAPWEPDAATRRTAELLCEPCGVLLETAEPAGPGPVARVPESLLLDLYDRPAAVVESDGLLSYANAAALAALTAGGGVFAPVGRPAAEVFPYAWAALGPATERAGAQRLGRLHGLEDVRVLPLGHGRSVLLWSAEEQAGEALSRVMGRLDRVGYFHEDLPGGETLWSRNAYRLFGMEPDAPPVPLARLGPRLHPEDRYRLRSLAEDLLERRRGGTADVRVLRPGGGVRHVRIAAEPLVAGASLTGLTGVYQDLSSQRRTEAALSAAQEDAHLRNRVVRQLQEAIVPEAPPAGTHGDLEVASRYRPAAHDYGVSGDWYDVLPLAGGRSVLVVGDLAGHGLQAATNMLVLRNALRGLAVTGEGPGRLMAWLNEVALRSGEHPTATVVCALFDPAERALRWASAGHLPLLLVRGGRARFLHAPHNILLGALPGAEYEEAQTRLESGDVLLLYTDGFVEHRRVSLVDTLEELRRVAERLAADPAAGASGPVEALADALLGAVRGDTGDDTSLLVVRVSPPPPADAA
ncbi:SpoIIE family protein phosphatase [Streptomyces sp. NPDC012888]|uniref:SpoIIE family protein phosphatase n=1 Tax=Streptomyces sp. NPDC012888 TaxID=3364855 RepID=UPI0036B6E87A